MGARTSASGFSLLELLIGAVCTSLLAAAVFSVLVSGAASTRRRWADLAAQSAVELAVAAAARDVREAGRGIELADAIRLSGERVDIVGATGERELRLVRALGLPREVVDSRPDGVYEIAGTTAIGPGDVVVAVGLPDRPDSAPAPAGVVTGVFPGIGTLEVRVAWGSGAASLEQWGEPRALVHVEVREYAPRRLDGAWQLRRRDGGRTWQPVIDGLDAFTVGWIVDTDDDGAGDTRVDSPGATARVCAVVIEATARADRARRPEAGPSELEPFQAVEWVQIKGC